MYALKGAKGNFTAILIFLKAFLYWSSFNAAFEFIAINLGNPGNASINPRPTPKNIGYSDKNIYAKDPPSRINIKKTRIRIIRDF